MGKRGARGEIERRGQERGGRGGRGEKRDIGKRGERGEGREDGRW